MDEKKRAKLMRVLRVTAMITAILMIVGIILQSLY